MRAILLFLLITITTSKVVRVQVESLCPDCRDFVVNSLAPFLDAVNSSMLATVELIFLGKATKNQTSFTCQHGEQECLGNAVLALAKQVYDDEEINYRLTNRFAICFIENWYLFYSNFDLDVIIEVCDENLRSIVAERLPKDIFKLLDKEFQKQPKDLIKSHVPYFEVIENDEIHHNDQDDDEMAHNLLEYLCNSSEEAKHVPACYNTLNVLSDI